MHARFSLTPEQCDSAPGFSRKCRFFASRELGAVTASTSARSLIISQIAQIDLRFLDRDAKSEIRSLLAINGGHRVPVLVFLSEDWFEVARYGERPLSTYRRMAAEQLGLAYRRVIPPLAEAIAALATEWLDESERSQLILSLSPRLRTRYGD